MIVSGLGLMLVLSAVFTEGTNTKIGKMLVEKNERKMLDAPAPVFAVVRRHVLVPVLAVAVAHDPHRLLNRRIVQNTIPVLDLVRVRLLVLDHVLDRPQNRGDLTQNRDHRPQSMLRRKR